MGLSAKLLKLTSVILVSQYVETQEIFDNKYKDTWGHLKKIPHRFELRSPTAISDFKRYANDIQDLVLGKNISIVYKIKVDVDDDLKKKKKNKLYKKIRSKKYNVPLKKSSMRSSNFEVLLKKLAENNGQKMVNHENLLEIVPTARPDTTSYVWTTKIMTLKYKPLIKQVKTNYTKIIKPVRSNIITLS